MSFSNRNSFSSRKKLVKIIQFDRPPGDIDDCIVTPIQQTQFTPLTEAICDVIMELTSHGHAATLDTIRKYLTIRFSNMQPPSNDIVYDTLVQLQQERKIYQTSKGFFIVTPE